MDGLVGVRDVKSGAELLTLRGHRGIVMGVVFHPRGDRVLSIARDGALRVWELQAPQDAWVRPALPVGRQFVLGLEGNHWAVVQDEGKSLSVRVQDWRTGHYPGPPVSLTKVTGRHQLEVKLNPEGTRLLTSLQSERPVAEWRCQLWNPRTGELVTSWTGKEVSREFVSLSADFRFLAVIRPNVGLILVKVDNSRQPFQLPAWQEAYGRAVFSPNGDFLANGDRPGKVLVSNLKSRTSVTLPIAERSLARAFSPDGSRLAVSVAHAIELWDTTTWRRLQTLPLAKEAADLLGVAFHPSGRRLAAINRKGEIKVWDTEEGREFPELQFPFSPGGLDGALNLCFDGDRLIAWSSKGRVAVWDGTPHVVKQP